LEASYLFGFSADAIEVVIHPQSIVHSLVRLRNGALYAQLSPPDMALPIMSALADGKFELEGIVKPLDFTNLTLNFSAPDFHRFPMLSLAYDAVRARGSYPIAFNGANEIAVNAFIQGKIQFNAIDRVVKRAMEADWSSHYSTLEEILAIDAAVRALSRTIVARMG
jgi:1-deoxy-D-xylulose-5-phosphate reductoisomerase